MVLLLGYDVEISEKIPILGLTYRLNCMYYYLGETNRIEVLLFSRKDYFSYVSATFIFELGNK